MVFVIIFSAVITSLMVVIRNNNIFSSSTPLPKEELKMYFGLVVAIFNVILAKTLFKAQKGLIEDGSKLNKYKLSKNNVLIRLKLFKYNNDANYLIIVPYLVSAVVAFVVVGLYFIYACGVLELKILFESAPFMLTVFFMIHVLIVYYAIIHQKIYKCAREIKTGFMENKKDE